MCDTRHDHTIQDPRLAIAVLPELVRHYPNLLGELLSSPTLT